MSKLIEGISPSSIYFCSSTVEIAVVALFQVVAGSSTDGIFCCDKVSHEYLAETDLIQAKSAIGHLRGVEEDRLT